VNSVVGFSKKDIRGRKGSYCAWHYAVSKVKERGYRIFENYKNYLRMCGKPNGKDYYEVAFNSI
jgi:hypothetical protein